MKFIEDESPTKLRGGYYTDRDTAVFLTRWILEARPKRVLEPSCGDGIFVEALASLPNESVEEFVAFEIHPEEAAQARVRALVSLKERVAVHTRDFLSWSLTQISGCQQFDAVVGNPPFIRYQYLDPILQQYSEMIFRLFRLPFTRHTNAWVPFVISSVALLRPGGRLAMVVPSELLHVLHARSLREYLSRQCSRVLIFDPAELWFEDVLQGAVLLLTEKKLKPSDPFQGVGIVRTKSRSFLRESPEGLFQHSDFVNGEAVTGKWMQALLTRVERDMINSVASNPSVRRFGQIAEVDVGIVTGANKFFLVPDAVVEEFGLHRWAHPGFGRAQHAPGVIYDQFTHETNSRSGLPTNLLLFTNEGEDSLTAGAFEYIRRGEREGLHRRYKCRIRRPWYALPSVYSVPVGLLKRCHHFPRLILNRVGALTTDTAYRVRPTNVASSDLVFAFVNSLTALSAELEGRHYGGGVLELVPSEIEKLLIPIKAAPEGDLALLDQGVRHAFPAEDVLGSQDRKILAPIGLSSSECDDLLAAWIRLRNRRQRSPHGLVL